MFYPKVYIHKGRWSSITDNRTWITDARKTLEEATKRLKELEEHFQKHGFIIMFSKIVSCVPYEIVFQKEGELPTDDPPKDQEFWWLGRDYT